MITIQASYLINSNELIYAIRDYEKTFHIIRILYIFDYCKFIVYYSNIVY